MEFTIYNEFSEALKQDWNNLLATSSPQVPFLRYEYLQHLVEAPRRRGMAAGGRTEADRQPRGRRNDRHCALLQRQHEGSKRLLLLGSIEISDYLDVISKDTDRASYSFVDWLSSSAHAPAHWVM